MERGWVCGRHPVLTYQLAQPASGHLSFPEIRVPFAIGDMSQLIGRVVVFPQKVPR